MSRRLRLHPLVGLGVVLALPALVLGAAWQLASAAADRHTDARRTLAAVAGASPVDEAVGTPVTDVAADATSVVAWRRSAHALSHRLNFTTFTREVEPLLALVNDRSCVAVSVNGELAGERVATTAPIPASVMKLVVGAVALDVLGEDFRFVTTLEGHLDDDGVIRGDLRLIGGGDPLLSSDWYPVSGMERNPVFHHTSLDDMVDDLVALGVTRVEGDVVGVADRYDTEFSIPGWAPGVAGVEAGPYAALVVNDSRVRGDPLRASDPVLGAAREFVRLLAERNVPVIGAAVADYAGTRAVNPERTELVRMASVPLTLVVEEMLTNSDNNTAEMMLKEIGYHTRSEGTRAAGLATMRDVLSGWDIDIEALTLDDASGLSRQNALSCGAVLQVLQRSGPAAPLGQGLAVAASTGTLRGIFTDSPMAGRLRAKTGTLNNPPFDRDPPAVKGLAGYLPLDGGGAIEFVLILNGLTISNQREYRPIWDRLGQVLHTYPAAAGIEALGPR